MIRCGQKGKPPGDGTHQLPSYRPSRGRRTVAMRRRSHEMEFQQNGQRSQIACGNRADLRPKDAGSEACTVMYRFCELPKQIGLAMWTQGELHELVLEAS